ncbi:7404_t:CDS:2 [Dentiscutata erythropus]|uniref:7404_t:CDS:1 n=1 Tax=Dentiscutata erythropus TaxID=1348616 RepID=A0A9N9A2Y4_9GLOM|nr:7404_t:CDS:2 [Dentiscutata erythropus]
MRNSKQKRKYLKSVSKTFSTDSQKFHSIHSNKHVSTPEVSTLLNKLRHESQPKSNQRLTETLPMPAYKYLMRAYLNQVEGEQRERFENDLRLRVSGPLPPRSWRGAWYSENTKLSSSNFDLPSLATACINTIAINIKNYISCPYFSNLPTHLKQNILSSLSIHNPLTDDLLKLFASDSEYDELDISNSSVSLECLKRSFWQMVNDNDDIVDDWEALMDRSESDDTDFLSFRYFKSFDSSSIWEKPVKDSSSLSTKYVSKVPELCRLNVSFTCNIPIIPLSKLVTSTIPLLSHLSIAGCSNHENGPQALRIFSTGLINLVFLEISHNDWVTDQVVLQCINWDRDLKYLKMLVAVCCFSWKDVDALRNKLSRGREIDIITFFTSKPKSEEDMALTSQPDADELTTPTTPLQQAQTEPDPLPQDLPVQEQEASTEPKVLSPGDEALTHISEMNQLTIPWPEVKEIIKERFEKETQLPIAVNGADPEQIDKVKAEIEEYKQNINKMLDGFEKPPFTIQRTAELLLRPFQHHKTLIKWLRALEKVLMVQSSVDEFPPVSNTSMVTDRLEIMDVTTSPKLVPITFTPKIEAVTKEEGKETDYDADTSEESSEEGSSSELTKLEDAVAEENQNPVENTESTEAKESPVVAEISEGQEPIAMDTSD